MNKKNSFKTRKFIAFLRRNNIWIFLIASIAVLLLPIVFTLKITAFPDFTSTGAIGDTIGGITSPFLNIGAAFLLYYTLMEQIKTNKKQNIELSRQKKDAFQQKMYHSFMREIDNIARDIYEFSSSKTSNTKGLAELNAFFKLFAPKYQVDTFIKDKIGSYHFLNYLAILELISNLWGRVVNAKLTPSDQETILYNIAWLYHGKLRAGTLVIKNRIASNDFNSNQALGFKQTIEKLQKIDEYMDSIYPSDSPNLDE